MGGGKQGGAFVKSGLQSKLFRTIGGWSGVRLGSDGPEAGESVERTLVKSSFVVAGVGGCTSHSSFDSRHVELYMLVGHPRRDFRRQFHSLSWSSRGNLVGNPCLCQFPWNN